MLQKTSCSVSGHDFRGCGKTAVCYQGCLAGGAFPYHEGGCPISGPILARCGKKRLLARECQSCLRIPGSRQSIFAWESSLLWRGFQAVEQFMLCIRARL